MQHLMRKIVGTLAVLALVAGCATPPERNAGKAGSAEIWWLGQSAMRITTVSGKVIMIDPWILGNPKIPPQFKNLDALGKLDLILVTHAHGDHLGDAVALAKKNNVPMWAPAGLNQQLQTLGELPAELSPRMNKGGTIQPFPGVKITQVHAEHSSEILWTDPATKKQHTLTGGEPVGFIIELENGFRIYHMGDTGLFGDMKLIGDYYKPDLIMIPIGGHFVMNPWDAAKATKEFLQPKYAIPMHYASNPFLVGTPQEYMDALGSYPVKVYPINPGDKLRF
jgi:L-ascorbate metabolism protein UlaG (beta-lactamase superfamily)